MRGMMGDDAFETMQEHMLQASPAKKGTPACSTGWRTLQRGRNGH